MILRGILTRLRPLTEEDAEMTLQWRLSDKARFLQRGAQTAEEQRNWISESNKKDLNFIVENLNDSSPCGMIALTDINMRHQTVSMGRMLTSISYGATAMFEADLLLSDYAFGDMGMYKIYGDVMVDNKAMIKTRQWLGYHIDGVLRGHYVYDGVHKDTVAVSMLRDEYFGGGRDKLVSFIAFLSGRDRGLWNTVGL